MRNRFNNEKGYALVLTIFVLLLFSLLTITLMTATLNGAKRNHVNETSLQATSLANKGIDYITARINSELKNGVTGDGISRSDFITLLTNTLNKYKTQLNSIKGTGSTGNYNVYISNIEDTVDSDGNLNPLRKRVTFSSTGIVDGEEKPVTTVVEFGAQAVLETLKYAVGANKCVGSNCSYFPGEGNMFLHGGVTIQGDFKVDGDLITTDRGYAYLGGDKWIDSQYPSVLPIQTGTDAHLVLGGNIYTFSNTPAYDKHISTTSFESNRNYVNMTNNINAAFYTNSAPVIEKRQVTRDNIQIDNQKSVFYYPVSEATTTINSNTSVFSNDLNYSNQKVYIASQSCFLFWCSTKYDGDYTFTGNNTFGNFATQGSLQIKSSTSTFKKTKFTNGGYIDKDLTIGNGSTSYDVKNYDKVQIDGPLFVNGNLNIQGADAQFNSIIYVMGDVNIQYSQINGLGSNGSLIIFAKGKIKISNNSVYQDTPSNIKGFFYSEDALEMFGVGSNIRIEGGISARRIVLNAIRGKASKSNFAGAQAINYNDGRYETDYYEGKYNQSSKDSRLQIIYDPYIMSTYADIKSREPIIKNIDPPQLISRSSN